MKIKLISLSTLLALGVAGSALAQTSPTTEAPPSTSPTSPTSHPMMHHMRGAHHDPFADLNLSAEQRTKIDGIMQQSKEQAEQNRQNTEKQINDVLTDEQKTKWAADKQHRRESWKEKELKSK